MTIAQNFCPNLPLLLLADFFLKSFAEKNRKLLKGSTPRAVYLMMRHEWPGNVRELENVVERAVIMTRYKMITPMKFPEVLKELEQEQKPSSVNLETRSVIKRSGKGDDSAEIGRDRR